MLLAVHISSYRCTWEVWRALKKLELLSVALRTTVTHLSCSLNFLRASITRYTHAKHEQILKCLMGLIFKVSDRNTFSDDKFCFLENICYQYSNFVFQEAYYFLTSHWLAKTNFLRIYCYFPVILLVNFVKVACL